MTDKAVNVGTPGHIDHGESAGASELKALLCTDALKLYKPPFRFDRGYIFDSESRMVFDDHGMDTVGRVRGWGRIQYLPNPEALQDKVGEMIAEALNDFWKKHSA